MIQIYGAELAIDVARADILPEGIMDRIWKRDHTVWKPAPTEIADRLGWLDCPENMPARLAEICQWANSIRRDGYVQAILLGMGGSSLAPETFRKTFGVRPGFPELTILDTTDPGTVLARARSLDLARTLFIVSTKSGGTVETFSLMKYFYNQVRAGMGPEAAGRHFTAITDPGSGIAAWAERLHFRHTFLNDPDIGGRYSALSCFGIVPAALIGVDVKRLLAEAATAGAGTRPDAAAAGRAFAGNAVPLGISTRPGAGGWHGQEALPATQREKMEGGRSRPERPDRPETRATETLSDAAVLGTALGELARTGRDKATFFFSPPLASFGAWLEQLLAESTGKEGRGIVPIVGEPPGSPESYGDDRVFIAVGLGGDRPQEELLAALRRARHPVLKITLADPYELGGQIFIWEMATAVAGRRLGINPFDQPDVEAAKALAREMTAAYRETGRLPGEKPAWSSAQWDIYGEHPSLADFLAQGKAGDYVALQAYVTPTPALDRALAGLRRKIRDRRRLATTAGYGPRYLHSTGQLHKGDGGGGLFIQFTAGDAEDISIPDEPGQEASFLTFGALKAAQATGDRRALRDRGRRVIRFHFPGDPDGAISDLL